MPSAFSYVLSWCCYSNFIPSGLRNINPDRGDMIIEKW